MPEVTQEAGATGVKYAITELRARHLLEVIVLALQAAQPADEAAMGQSCDVLCDVLGVLGDLCGKTAMLPWRLRGSIVPPG
jgi:hypothetical protein